jgi:hypothetical protein
VNSGEVAFGGCVISRRYTSPGLELVDGALDGVAVAVEIRVVGEGRPPWLPFLARFAAWSFFSGMTALMRRLRRWVRLAREE